MDNAALTLWVSCRRDAITLTALAVGVAAWAWAQSTLLVVVGGVICALLYVAAVAVVRQAQRIEQETALALGKWTLPLWAITLLLCGSAAIALLSAAAFDAIGQWGLVVAVATLTGAWQVWLYFWMGD